MPRNIETYTTYARQDKLPAEITFPGSAPYKKQGNHRKSYMVIYENIQVTEITIEIYGNMRVIKRPYYSMIPCKSYTVP